MPDPFLAILSHSPSEAAWFSSSQASQASREAKGMIGRSLVVMTSPFDDRCRCITSTAEGAGESGLYPFLVVCAARPCRESTGLAAHSQVEPAYLGCSIAVSCGSAMHRTRQGARFADLERVSENSD